MHEGLVDRPSNLLPTTVTPMPIKWLRLEVGVGACVMSDNAIRVCRVIVNTSVCQLSKAGRPAMPIETLWISPEGRQRIKSGLPRAVRVLPNAGEAEFDRLC